MSILVTDPGNGGPNTLRQAIIDIPANGLIEIDASIALITLTSAELSITKGMTIISLNPSGTVIRRSDAGGTPAFRIFNISGGVNVTIQNITIRNGAPNAGGGGIQVSNSSLTLRDSVVTANVSVSFGGGIYATGSDITLDNVTLSINTVVEGSGGGIYATGGTLSISYSNIFNNTVANAGGGIYSRLNIANITYTTVENNTANAGVSIGGGIVFDTAISFNLTYSLITNNSATGTGAGSNGGGIYITATGASGSISNTTISHNTVAGNVVNGGGGMYVASSSIELRSVTIARNHSEINAGGIYNSVDSIINIGNTIIGNNTADGVDPDVSGTYDSEGGNLIENVGTATGFIPPDDILGVDPLLGALSNNGGVTRTMALLPGSPALDVGLPGLNGSLWDQRGEPFSRVYNGVIDIGAFETQNICYSGKSRVLTRNVITNDVKVIRAENVVSGIHEVFDMDNQCFVPVKFNIIARTVNRFILIQANSIAPNQPTTDFYVTPGHTIVINGKKYKAKEVPGAKRVKVRPQKVYSICTPNQCAININGIGVLSWGYEEWLEYSKNNGITWIDNNDTCETIPAVFNQEKL